MKLKRFIAMLLVLVMTSSCIPSSLLVYATDNNASLESSTPTESVETNLESDEGFTLTDTVASNNSFVEMTFSSVNGFTEDSVLSVEEGEPDGDQMLKIMEMCSIESVLDFMVLDMFAENISTTENVDFYIEFNEPYLKALSSNEVYLAIVKADGSTQKLENVFIDLTEERYISKISSVLNGFDSSIRIVLITKNSTETLQGQSGSNVGTGGADGGNAPSGQVSNIRHLGCSVGVTMQVVYYKYKDCWNRVNSYECVRDTLLDIENNPHPALDKNGKVLSNTVLDGFTYYKDNTFSGSGANYGIAVGELYPWRGSTFLETGSIYDFLNHIIFGSQYGAWDKKSVGADDSLYTQVLRLLGTPEGMIDNYLKSFNDQLSVSKDGEMLIPTIVWSWIGYDDTTAGGITALPGSVLSTHNNKDNVETADKFLKTAYKSPDELTKNNFNCYWCPSLSYVKTCDMMLNISHKCHSYTDAVVGDASKYGTGFVNSINAEGVDATDGGQYYFRGYWTPYGHVEETPLVDISVKKLIEPSNMATGENLKNWRFELYATKEAALKGGTDYLAVAYTNSNGIATFNDVEANAVYYVREAPASRQDKKADIDKWKLSSDVLSVSATAGSSATISAGSITNYAGGSLSVTKNVLVSAGYTSDKANWRFELYETEADAEAGINYIASEYTNADGVATFEGLTSGKTYFVKEAPASRQDKRNSTSGWVLDTTVLSGTIVAGNIVSAGTATNTSPVSLSVTKNIVPSSKATSENLQNWRFELYATETDAENGGENYLQVAYTDENGIATFTELQANTTYYVKEAPASRQDKRSDLSIWTLNTSVVSGYASANSSTVVSIGSITNYTGGNLTVTKRVSGSFNSSDKAGWRFELFESKEKANVGNEYIAYAYTDASGVAVFEDLTHGKTYYVKEAPASRQDKKTTTGWILSTTVLSGTITSGGTVNVGTVTNVPPCSLTVTKKITPSNKETSANLRNWRFEIYLTKAAAQAGGTDYLDYAYTDSKGIATFSNLTANKTYYVREAPASRQDKRTNLNEWRLSSTVLTVTVRAGWGGTTSAGSITNYIGGSLSVTKNIAASGDFVGDKSDWKFELFDSKANADAGTGYITYVYTDANGVATFDDLTNGKTYYVKEAPASRQDKKTTTGWTLSTTVLSGTITAGETVEVGTITNTAPASLSVTKDINSTGDFVATKSNWRFELYSTLDDAENGIGFIDYAYTNTNGIATFYNLINNQTYYVREAPASRQDKWDTTGWLLSTEVKVATVTPGANTSVGTISNDTPSQITGVKSVLSESVTPEKLSGWIYQIARDRNFTDIVSTVTSDETGKWATGFVLPAGTYYVREAPLGIQTRSDKDNFVIDNTVVTVRVSAGESGEAYQENKNYTSQNIEKGRIQIKKGVSGIDANTSSLKDWIFHVYSDAECTAYVTSVTTGTDGIGISDLLTPNDYWVKEALKDEQTRSDAALWAISNDVVPVAVRAGTVTNAYDTNSSTVINSYGKHIKLIKTSNNEDNPDCYEQIKDNNMYTLAGAQYQIIVNDIVQETITTDETGVVISNNIYSVGTSGFIKEIVAPNGYLIDTKNHSFIIENDVNEYCEIKVSDIPVFDPVSRRFKKTTRGTGVAQGNTSFEGAVFKYEYFDNTEWSGEPVRTWYFETNEEGIHGYHANFIALDYPSDELYEDTNNSYQIPLGSVKITEVVSPLGYKELPVLYSIIVQESVGAAAKFNYTDESLAILSDLGNGLYAGEEPQDLESFASLAIEKLDKNLEADSTDITKFAGCEFTIYNKSANPVKIGDFAIAQPDEACYVLTIDNTGKVSTDFIFPIGTYEVKETKGNDYYQCNTDWSYTFTVDGSSTNPTFVAQCENSMKAATIKIQKLNTEKQPLAGSKFLLEYSLDGETDWKPVFKSNDFAIGGCSNSNLTEDGCLVVDADGEIIFEGLSPVAYYRITEVETLNGYQLLKEPIIIDPQTAFTPDNNFETGYRIINNKSFAMPKTGVNDFWMLIPSFFLASLAMFCITYVATLPDVKREKCKNN